MNKIQNNIVMIEDYLDGNLVNKELHQFNDRLQSDSELSQQLQLREKMATLWSGADDYQKTNAHVSQAIKEAKIDRFRIYGKRFLSIAASVVVLFGITWGFNHYSHSNETVPQFVDVDDSSNDINEQSSTLQMDKPAQYATFKEVPNDLVIISALDKTIFNEKEEIILKWKSEAASKSILNVINSTNDSVVYHANIDLSKRQHSISTGILSAGNYSWFINAKQNEKGSFKITGQHITNH